MKNRIEIYDTTLRDGSQGSEINFSVADKLRICERLDAFGVCYIEGGWPGSNPKDIKFFTQAKELHLRHAKLAAFGSTRRKGVPVADDPQVRMLVEADTPVVTIFGKTSVAHVREVLRCSLSENIAMIGDTIRFLRQWGKTVIYDAEHCFDGYKLDRKYAEETWAAAADAGADVVVLCDTNGGSLPEEVGEITHEAVRVLKCPVGVHTHNDIGLGVANALAAVKNGALQVQGTINGYGERVGNCNLISVIPCLHFKAEVPCINPDSLVELRALSQFVDEVANLRHNPRQPWVGSAAFAHKGGTHVNAVQKSPASYEHIDPEQVGNHRTVLVGELSGRSNIALKARTLGLSLDDAMLPALLQEVKRREHRGYEYEAAEASFALLILRMTSNDRTPLFDVPSYHVSMRRGEGRSVCEATVKVHFDGKVEHRVAEGDGPVNALDGALRAALTSFFPKLANMRLVDYRVRIIDEGHGTAARTRVLIQSADETREWGTVGVHENIVEASLEALTDSFRFALL